VVLLSIDFLKKDFSPIGHAPDQFGHTSQLPQILLQFGMIAASSMRGIPNRAQARVFLFLVSSF
jgi:alpha-mannosidase